MTSVNHNNNSGAAGGNDMNAFFSEVCFPTLLLVLCSAIPGTLFFTLPDLEQEPAKQYETRNRREFNIGLNVDMGAKRQKRALEEVDQQYFQFWRQESVFVTRAGIMKEARVPPSSMWRGLVGNMRLESAL